MPLPDYHIHTRLCNHAEGEMEEYIERAIALGLTEIGFSDHMPVMPEPHLCMSFDDLPVYVSRVLELRDRYKDNITIKLGGEMDIVHERLDEIRDIIAQYPFDYIIGSLHYLDGWPFDQAQYSDVFEKEDVYTLYERYFDAVIRAAETRVYDTVGHIDVIKCMGYRPDRDLSDLYERTAQTLKTHDLVFEINTSGFDKPAAEQYPSAEFMKILRSHEVPVTTGSDSHKPEHVGRYFTRALNLLEECGFTSVTSFTRRQRETISIGRRGNTGGTGL